MIDEWYVVDGADGAAYLRRGDPIRGLSIHFSDGALAHDMALKLNAHDALVAALKAFMNVGNVGRRLAESQTEAQMRAYDLAHEALAQATKDTNR